MNSIIYILSLTLGSVSAEDIPVEPVTLKEPVTVRESVRVTVTGPAVKKPKAEKIAKPEAKAAVAAAVVEPTQPFLPQIEKGDTILLEGRTDRTYKVVSRYGDMIRIQRKGGYVGIHDEVRDLNLREAQLVGHEKPFRLKLPNLKKIPKGKTAALATAGVLATEYVYGGEPENKEEQDLKALPVQVAE